MAPIKLVAGNWKMNGSLSGARLLAEEIAAKSAPTARRRVAVCPPFPLLSSVGAFLKGSGVLLGAQDCHAHEKGAHTGDVSAKLLSEVGCRIVIVGHSERRTDHRETDDMVRAKAEAALAAGLDPIVCVGETEAERDAGRTKDVVERQVPASWPKGGTVERCVIAYEPVWAIGTGKTPTVGDVAEVHSHIRSVVAKLGVAAENLAILYGGSVKGSNAPELMAVPGVDGALVGGASLDAADFLKIVNACQ
ncbi:MAG: triose-phosphate isomerase [Alphaproteobacteria bacterium]|nr:triose-phosphate isomerase [Alphaproteobacteria bacterium]